MRLADVDVIIKDLTAMKRVYDAIELDGMIKALKEAQTIDPVKHGKWGETYYHYGEGDFVRDCSECGEPYSPPTRYCPNCGARMDGE